MTEQTNVADSPEQGTGPKILVVEDSAIQATMLNRLLNQAGYHTEVATDGLAALERLREQEFDLVLSDVNMPRMNGIELCKAITQDKALQKVSVMLVTTLSAPEDICEGIEAGADGYIVKPYREQYLLSKVKQELAAPRPKQEREPAIKANVDIGGKIHTVTASPSQFLKLMISTYENALQQNEELIANQFELTSLNKRLEANIEALSTSEQEQRASEERFRSIVQLIPDIVFRIDLDGKFIFINDAIQSLGYIPEDLLGKHFSTIIDAPDLERCSSEKMLPRYGGKETGDAGAPKLFDERRTGARATRGLEVHLLGKLTTQNRHPEIFRITGELNSSGYYQGNSIGEHGLAGTVGAIRDITERKLFEEKLNALNLSLEEKVGERTRDLVNVNQNLERTLDQLKTTQESIIQSEKLSALGTLVAGVAHELNNPLMGALNYVQYAIKKIDDEKLVKNLGKAEKNIERAAKIIHNMLNFARKPSGEIERVSVKEAVQSAAELLAADYLHNQITLNIEIPEDLPKVQARQDGLQQIFLNLLTNAMHELTDKTIREVNVRARAQDDAVHVEVSDSGNGIAEENLRRIFDPFFTTKPPGTGTGLGLSISSKLMSTFGGELHCDNNPGKGATFVMKLKL